MNASAGVSAAAAENGRSIPDSPEKGADLPDAAARGADASYVCSFQMVQDLKSGRVPKVTGHVKNAAKQAATMAKSPRSREDPMSKSGEQGPARPAISRGSVASSAGESTKASL